VDVNKIEGTERLRIRFLNF